MNKTITEVLKATDYRMLSKQKVTIVRLSENPLLTQQERDDLEGILNWMDAIQDAVVGENILPEEEVFPNLEKFHENE